MQLDVNDQKSFLAAIVLHSNSFIEQLMETEDWKNSKINSTNMEVKLTVGGVEVDATMLQDYFQSLADSYEEYVREKYDANNIDKLVEERAEKILEKHADNILEKFRRIEEVINDPSNVIKATWERDEDDAEIIS